MKKTYYDRKWLNSEEVEGGSAFVLATRDEFKVADCNRMVSLDFSIYEYTTNKELDNLNLKIDTLFVTVKDFRRFIKAKIKQARKEIK